MEKAIIDKTYRVLGMMSGTSLDGLDLALCSFTYIDRKWAFTFEQCDTVEYPYELEEKLRQAHAFSGANLVALDFELGHYFGHAAQRFLEGKTQPDFIASHGHTILHMPQQHYTRQIGKPEAIAAITNVDVIGDFRSMDVALGGQGAPLVPIGDRLLFSEFSACVNLGGFANISFEENGQRMAYDVCPANMLLNEIVKFEKLKYDKGGALAREGEIIVTILDRLNAKDYFHQPYPKSLGKEWYEKEYHQFVPFLLNGPEQRVPIKDLLATAVEHITQQLVKSLARVEGPILFTGGGSHNTFLMERLRFYLKEKVVVPDAKLVDFKEALIFAFLGVLRQRKEINVLKSVTGANKDHCSGGIWVAPSQQ